MKDLSNENIVHIKRKNIEYLQFRRFLEYEDILEHCCYTLSSRNTNFTRDKFLNKDLSENYKKLGESLNFDYTDIATTYQEHTDIIEKVDKVVKRDVYDTEAYKGVDGLITDKKGIPLLIRFADCTPILIFDPVKKVISNAHSGWKGTVKQIARRAVQKMISEYGSDPKDILCGIGPCVKQCHFEVDQDVRDIFLENFGYMDQIDDIIKLGQVKDGVQKYHIDTTLVNKLVLEEEGILPQNIITSNICTVCNSDVMHSYRAQGELAGRNCSIMCLKK